MSNNNNNNNNNWRLPRTIDENNEEIDSDIRTIQSNSTTLTFARPSSQPSSSLSGSVLNNSSSSNTTSSSTSGADSAIRQHILALRSLPSAFITVGQFQQHNFTSSSSSSSGTGGLSSLESPPLLQHQQERNNIIRNLATPRVDNRNTINGAAHQNTRTVEWNNNSFFNHNAESSVASSWNPDTIATSEFEDNTTLPSLHLELPPSDTNNNLGQQIISPPPTVTRTSTIRGTRPSTAIRPTDPQRIFDGNNNHSFNNNNNSSGDKDETKKEISSTDPAQPSASSVDVEVCSESLDPLDYENAFTGIFGQNRTLSVADSTVEGSFQSNGALDNVNGENSLTSSREAEDGSKRVHKDDSPSSAGLVANNGSSENGIIEASDMNYVLPSYSVSEEKQTNTLQNDRSPQTKAGKGDKTDGNQASKTEHVEPNNNSQTEKDTEISLPSTRSPGGIRVRSLGRVSYVRKDMAEKKSLSAMQFHHLNGNDLVNVPSFDFSINPNLDDSMIRGTDMAESNEHEPSIIGNTTIESDPTPSLFPTVRSSQVAPIDAYQISSSSSSSGKITGRRDNRRKPVLAVLCFLILLIILAIAVGGICGIRGCRIQMNMPEAQEDDNGVRKDDTDRGNTSTPPFPSNGTKSPAHPDKTNLPVQTSSPAAPIFSSSPDYGNSLFPTMTPTQEPSIGENLGASKTMPVGRETFLPTSEMSDFFPDDDESDLGTSEETTGYPDALGTLSPSSFDSDNGDSDFVPDDDESDMDKSEATTGYPGGSETLSPSSFNSENGDTDFIPDDDESDLNTSEETTRDPGALETFSPTSFDSENDDSDLDIPGERTGEPGVLQTMPPAIAPTNNNDVLTAAPSDLETEERATTKPPSVVDVDTPTSTPSDISSDVSTVAPTMQNGGVSPSIPSTSLRPAGTISPVIRPVVLTSTEELYNAVDEYLQGNSTLQPIDEWDVSQISNFNDVFSARRNPAVSDFNEDLNQWTTSGAMSMERMFMGAAKFNGRITGWDVSRVTSMSAMFARADLFNGNIGAWNVGQVQNMYGMFRRASSFNSNIALWDTSRVTNMANLFLNAASFNQDIGDWSTVRSEDMRGTFRSAVSFNQDLRWSTSRVTSMENMFMSATSFNGDLSTFDTSQTKFMTEMFAYASSFEGKGLSSFDTTSVETMTRMFFAASSFLGEGLDTWNVQNVIDMSLMFTGASLFDQDLCPWRRQLIQSRQPGLVTDNMFYGTSCARTEDPQLDNLSKSSFCAICDNTQFSSSAPITSPNVEDSFTTGIKIQDKTELQIAVDEYILDQSPSSDVSRIYGWPIGKWNVEHVSDFSDLFSAERNPNMFKFDFDLSNWNVSSATNMASMFHSTVDFRINGDSISGWDVSKVTNMSHMFDSSSFSGDISKWNVENVRTFDFFAEFAVYFNSDLSNWNVKSAESMGWMFRGAQSFNSELTNWDVSEVTDFSSMFAGATSFKSNLCPWGELLANTEFNNNNNIQVRAMFASTSCHNQNDPSLSRGRPWCRPCSSSNLQNRSYR